MQPTLLVIPLDLFSFFLHWDTKLSQSGTQLIERTILPLSLSRPFKLFLILAMHHAVLPYCDPSALRTPCLPPDSFLLPQPSTGKRVPLSQFCMLCGTVCLYLLLYLSSVCCHCLCQMRHVLRPDNLVCTHNTVQLTLVMSDIETIISIHKYSFASLQCSLRHSS